MYKSLRKSPGLINEFPTETCTYTLVYVSVNWTIYERRVRSSLLGHDRVLGILFRISVTYSGFLYKGERCKFLKGSHDEFNYVLRCVTGEFVYVSWVQIGGFLEGK